MKRTLPLLFILSFVIFSSFVTYSQTSPDSSLYFGQTFPGNNAVIFAPGILSLTNRLEDHVAFSPNGNECYFTVWGANFSSAKIYYTKRENNIWSPQVEAPFSVGHYTTGPFFSKDGNKLYFGYSDSQPGDIWMVKHTSQGWSDPQLLPSPINSNNSDYSYSETADSIAYFASNRPGGLGVDIWCTRRISGQLLQAVNLGIPVNSSAADFDPCIAHDGSYLIFTSERPGGHGNSDIYVSFAKSNLGWTAPVNIDRINTNASEVGPTLSPDGRFLFFIRYDRSGGEETEDIYWVSTKIIDSLKHSNFVPYVKNGIPDQKAVKNSLFNLQIPDSTFIDDNGNNTLTYSATLNSGSPLPGWLSFEPATRTFSGTPLTTRAIPLSIKVTATDTAHASASCLFNLSILNPTGVEEDNGEPPARFELNQNYSNPFNPSTVISYQLPTFCNLRLKIYDTLGREIKSLVNSFQNAGKHSIVWNGTNDNNNSVSSGIYFYNLQADKLNFQKKLILVR